MTWTWLSGLLAHTNAGHAATDKVARPLALAVPPPRPHRARLIAWPERFPGGFHSRGPSRLYMDVSGILQ